MVFDFDGLVIDSETEVAGCVVEVLAARGVAAADKRAEATYEDADAVLQTALAIQQHLAAQDAELTQILGQISQLRGA